MSTWISFDPSWSGIVRLYWIYNFFLSLPIERGYLLKTLWKQYLQSLLLTNLESKEGEALRHNVLTLVIYRLFVCVFKPLHAAVQTPAQLICFVLSVLFIQVYEPFPQKDLEYKFNDNISIILKLWGFSTKEMLQIWIQQSMLSQHRKITAL